MRRGGVTFLLPTAVEGGRRKGGRPIFGSRIGRQGGLSHIGGGTGDIGQALLPLPPLALMPEIG